MEKKINECYFDNGKGQTRERGQAYWGRQKQPEIWLAKVGITFKKQENIMFEFKNIHLSIKYRFIFFSLHSEFSKTTFYPKSKSVLESCFSKGGEET